VPTFLGFVFLGLATLGSLETPPTRKRLAFTTTYLFYIMWYIPLHNGKHMCLWFSPSSNGLWEMIWGGGAMCHYTCKMAKTKYITPKGFSLFDLCQR
jgi:hypothetical protein